MVRLFRILTHKFKCVVGLCDIIRPVDKTIHLLQDMPSAVEKIARFLHVELNSDHVGAVVKANTFQEKKKANSSDIKLRKGKKLNHSHGLHLNKYNRAALS